MTIREAEEASLVELLLISDHEAIQRLEHSNNQSAQAVHEWLIAVRNSRKNVETEGVLTPRLNNRFGCPSGRTLSRIQVVNPYPKYIYHMVCCVSVRDGAKLLFALTLDLRARIGCNSKLTNRWSTYCVPFHRLSYLSTTITPPRSTHPHSHLGLCWFAGCCWSGLVPCLVSCWVCSSCAALFVICFAALACCFCALCCFCCPYVLWLLALVRSWRVYQFRSSWYTFSAFKLYVSFVMLLC